MSQLPNPPTVRTTADSKGQIQSLVNSLLARSASIDPVLLTILQEITDELGRLGFIIDPAPTVSAKISSAGRVTPNPPLSLIYSLTDINVILEWTAPDSNFYYYELRKGASWTTADKLLVTANQQAILDALPQGSHTYLLKTLTSQGVYSADTASVVVVIAGISAVTITPIVVANAVTLSWNVPTSVFKIDHYVVKREGVIIATTSGTFFAISEEVAGTYTFSVTPVDIAGNEGPTSETSIVTTGITDYIFFDRLSSTFTGTFVNGKLEGDAAYFNINTTESFEDHFINNGWASPQAQVTAGYPLWLSPFETTGSYEEVFDFGVVISNVVVNLSWLFEVLAGSFAFGIEAEVSDDGVSWSATKTTQSFYVTSLRYVRVKLNFTSDDESLLRFSQFIVSLNVKRENDGGFATGLASDALGTAVEFNKTFVDVESIVVTPISETAAFATYEFDDIPFPTEFTVKIFDNAGVRITRDFRWAARGIV